MQGKDDQQQTAFIFNSQQRLFDTLSTEKVIYIILENMIAGKTGTGTFNEFNGN